MQPTELENSALKELIAEAIRQDPAKSITFARFMEMALYQPGEGYYTHRSGLIGARGDFYTAPHLTPVFGELVARQVAEFWERLGRPSRFEVVEVGAGQGLLAGDILIGLQQAVPELWNGLTYTIIEISESLQKAQKRRIEALPDGIELFAKTRWCSFADLESDSVVGCFISNELLDAFPVHLVTIEAGQLREIYVGYDKSSQTFYEQIGELSDPALSSYFENLGINLATYESGYRTEVNLQALAWLENVARCLQKGFVLTIDYGYEAAQRYHPLRTSGTLQCYTTHTVNANPYQKIGQQDMTAHVDFTTLMRAGEKSGLTVVGYTRQALFLASLGIGEKLARLSGTNLTSRQKLAEHEALQRLINPTSLGNFGVLIQAKNMPLADLNLSGLALQL